MKIKRFRNEDLRNEEWFQFYTEFKEIIEERFPGTLNIEALFATFLILYANANETLEIIRKSATTEQLAEADTTRDIVFRGFYNAVQSALYHFDAMKRAAAKRLQVVLDHYGNIGRKSYDEETAAITNLLQDFTSAYASDIALLGLGDWLAQLDADNKAFRNLMKTRYTEDAGKTDLRMKDVRKDTDRIYRDIIDRIEALMLINGETEYAPFVKELNVRVERFADILAQRKGRAAKKTNE
jgi:hypothetical protein